MQPITIHLVLLNAANHSALFEQLAHLVAWANCLWFSYVTFTPVGALLFARLPPLGFRDLVTPCGFRGERNESGYGFLGDFPVYLYHKFQFIIFPYSSHSLHFIVFCDGTTDMVGRDPCYIEASSNLIPLHGLVSETSWGDLNFMF